MLKKLIFIFLLCCFSPQAKAEKIFLELFTSQGCSACPPAEELLAEIKNRDGVIALACHVDYWDRIGWKDPYSLAECTKRQKIYSAGTGKMFTPQMFVSGVFSTVGYDYPLIENAINSARKSKKYASVSINNGKLEIKPVLDFNGHIFDVLLIEYLPETKTQITSGENAGRLVENYNVITSIRKIYEWKGKPEAISIPEFQDNAVVIIQRRGQLQIIAAVEL